MNYLVMLKNAEPVTAFHVAGAANISYQGQDMLHICDENSHTKLAVPGKDVLCCLQIEEDDTGTTAIGVVKAILRTTDQSYINLVHIK